MFPVTCHGRRSHPIPPSEREEISDSVGPDDAAIHEHAPDSRMVLDQCLSNRGRMPHDAGLDFQKDQIPDHIVRIRPLVGMGAEGRLPDHVFQNLVPMLRLDVLWQQVDQREARELHAKILRCSRIEWDAASIAKILDPVPLREPATTL